MKHCFYFNTLLSQTTTCEKIRKIITDKNYLCRLNF